MILAGDVGGTKTLLGLLTAERPRPRLVHAHAYRTSHYMGLPQMVDEFLAGQPEAAVAVAVFGVAGPVIDQAATMTNIDWRVDAAEMRDALNGCPVRLLNDLEALAHAVLVLDGDELHTLQTGQPKGGNCAIVAAGTGLGGAFLHQVGGQYVPMATEVGHSDFAARTDREMALARFIRNRAGRVDIEHVVSGRGLVTLAEFTHEGRACHALTGEDELRPAKVSASALQRTCVDCVEALDIFVESLGAVAGNMALASVATGGVFLGGGIPPRILPALKGGSLLAAFCDKGPMRALVESIPVKVILNDQAGLLGAAVAALRAG